MKIEISMLPWPCAIARFDGTLHQSNAHWRQRFGASDELAQCLPEAAEKLRIAVQQHANQAARAGSYFDYAMRAPGELSPVRMRFAAVAAAVAGEKSNQSSPTADEMWLLTLGENSEPNSDESALTPFARGNERDEERDLERALDAVVLRLQARNWRAFFRDAAAGKALVCLRGQTLEVNAALCELTGYSEGELVEICARDLRHPDDRERVTSHYQTILEGGASVTGIESRYRHKNGHYLTCLLSLTLIRDSRGKPLYFTAEIEDITLRRHIEQRLREQTRQLEYANRELLRSNSELERFAFVASHDLQEPLRRIRVFGDRLLETSLDNDNAPRYVDGMVRAAERMQNLIEDLLSYGRLQEQTNPFAPVDLNALWAQLREEFDEAIRECGARIEVGPLPVVSGNAFRLKQLFANLLSNALKFRGALPPLIEVSATTMGENNANNSRAPVEIEVRDNGIGFEPDQSAVIFEVFARLHTRRDYPGTGIGLAICRRVAREHGGDVRAVATPGRGARFIVTLTA